MRKTLHYILVLIASLMLAGCEAPRIDSSSEESLTKSLENVREGLSSEERDRFDALFGEIAVSAVLASAFTKDTVTLAMLMQPYDGLTGSQFLQAAEKEKAEKAAEAKARVQAREAEAQAREAEAQARADEERTDALAKIAALEKRKVDVEAERQILSLVEISDARVVKSEDSFMLEHELYSKLKNGLSQPLARVEFNYVLKSPDRAVPWDTGEGYFSIDGGLEPGETRELQASAWPRSFILLYQRAQDHPEAKLNLVVTDASDADYNSILKLRPLDLYEERELDTLKRSLDSE